MSTGVLVYAGNLRAGGAVQVAASFLNEIASWHEDTPSEGRWAQIQTSWAFEVSPEVYANLGSQAREVLPVRVIRESKFISFVGSAVAIPRRFDLEFVVFGPVYRRSRGQRQILGFADVRSLTGLPRGLSTSRRSRRLHGMRTFVIRRLVRATTFVIVETEFARKCLVEQFRVSAQKVAVIPNAPSAPFISADSGQDAVIDFPTDACCRLLYVARGYPHKNHEFLAALGQELQSRHNLTVEFVVTLRPDEWGRTSRLFRKFSHNVGEVLVSQLPGIYRACDGAIFPSLAEVYSATPVEAIAAGVPLFACDRPYVRTVIGDAAAYFDPLDPYSAADVLARVIRDPTALSQLRELGRAVLRTLPTAAERAERYYGLIQDLRENGKPT